MIWPTDILSLETWILILTLLGIFRYYLHRKWSVLKKWNISHCPPSILKMGNMLDAFGKGAFTYGLEAKEKYGPIYGLYVGTAPAIVIHDIDILRQIFIKEFSNFSNREVNETRLSGKELNTSLASVHGPRWKRLRSTMSPSFSSAKLRYMVRLMEWCAENTVTLLENRQKTGDGSFKVKDLFSRLSLDIVLSSAFSAKVNSQDDTRPEPEISKQAKELFQFSLFSPLVFLVVMFPAVGRIAEKLNLSTLKSRPLKYFTNVTRALMDKKVANPHEQNRVDLMQLLLENRVTEDDVKRGIDKGMTDNEIVGNSMVMILAGYENTANTMGYLAYNLAMHPEIQTQVQAEIDEMMQSHGKFDYDGMNKLKYFDMCLSESLRLYMPIIGNARASKEEITINGFTIPAKTTISVPTFALAHDPDHWEEPYEFRPERMRDMKQIDPMLFLPFGAGPRNCIGMRFATLEVKMALVKILHKFDIKPTVKTPNPPLELVLSSGIRPKVELELRVVPRQTTVS